MNNLISFTKNINKFVYSKIFNVSLLNDLNIDVTKLTVCNIIKCIDYKTYVSILSFDPKIIIDELQQLDSCSYSNLGFISKFNYILELVFIGGHTIRLSFDTSGVYVGQPIPSNIHSNRYWLPDHKGLPKQLPLFRKFISLIPKDYNLMDLK